MFIFISVEALLYVYEFDVTNKDPKKAWNVRINVTLRRVHVAIIAVEKQ